MYIDIVQMITDGEYINGSFLRQIIHLHFDIRMNDELNLMGKKTKTKHMHILPGCL
jgi:hypothetical protein